MDQKQKQEQDFLNEIVTVWRVQNPGGLAQITHADGIWKSYVKDIYLSLHNDMTNSYPHIHIFNESRVNHPERYEYLFTVSCRSDRHVVRELINFTQTPSHYCNVFKQHIQKHCTVTSALSFIPRQVTKPPSKQQSNGGRHGTRRRRSRRCNNLRRATRINNRHH
jgi:hypothetical protein